jgi:hypothetical protein
LPVGSESTGVGSSESGTSSAMCERRGTRDLSRLDSPEQKADE